MVPLYPDLSGKSPEHRLAQILQITRFVLVSTSDIKDRKSLRILDLALLNAIDDLEQSMRCIEINHCVCIEGLDQLVSDVTCDL